MDSIEKSFKYEHGIIQLKGGIGKMKIPAGFKYFNSTQAEKVLVDYWGNPKSEEMSLGMILPENQGILSDKGYVFNIQYEDVGFVKDDDAEDINYDNLMKDMKKETIEENKARQKEGFEPIEIVGWASKPYYDTKKKILHWAKEIKFGTSEENTLNYEIRILGRKGVLDLNAISTMSNLALVKQDLNKVLDIVEFNEGYQYKDFNPGVDKVAAWTIGGLVAGKILAKAGFFAILLKFSKVIILAVLAFFGGLWKRIRGKKEVSPEQYSSGLPDTDDNQNIPTDQNS